MQPDEPGATPEQPQEPQEPQSTVLRQSLDVYVNEALDLRFGYELPDVHGSPKETLDALHEIRGRLDRVEYLYGRVMRIRARTKRYADASKARADEAWDIELQSFRQRTDRRGDEFVSAKERYAHANLATVDDQREARQAAELASIAEEAHDLLRLTHRGLADLRQELLAVLRGFQHESSLER
jgi:hypothetical protein